MSREWPQWGAHCRSPKAERETQRERGGQKTVTSQAGADRSDLPLPRAQEDAGEVSGTGAAEQPRGKTTRLRGIRRQRPTGREHGGGGQGGPGGDDCTSQPHETGG